MKNKYFKMIFYSSTQNLMLLAIKMIKNIYQYAAKPHATLCRIEEINLTDKIILVHCQGINTPIKLTLSEIIYDHSLLINLPSTQTSLLGYYYGKDYHENIKGNFNLENFNFFIDKRPGKFNILMLNRLGHIVYSNEKNTTQVISPRNAMKCINIITQFNQIQACYIGILAGINANKKKYSFMNNYLKKNY